MREDGSSIGAKPLFSCSLETLLDGRVTIGRHVGDRVRGLPSYFLIMYSELDYVL